MPLGMSLVKGLTRRRCSLCEKYSSIFGMIALFRGLTVLSFRAKYVQFPYDQRSL
jgi:hypothetical protein